jgi:hypothetical protein
MSLGFVRILASNIRQGSPATCGPHAAGNEASKL